MYKVKDEPASTEFNPYPAASSAVIVAQPQYAQPGQVG